MRQKQDEVNFIEVYFNDLLIKNDPNNDNLNKENVFLALKSSG